MTATTTEAWFIRPTTTSNGRMFLAVAKDGEGNEAVAKDRYGVVEFRTVEAARRFIRETFHNGRSFPAIRTGSDAEINARIRYGALYC